MNKKPLFTIASLLLCVSSLTYASTENQIQIGSDNTTEDGTEIIDTGNELALPQLESTQAKTIRLAWKQMDGKASSIGISTKGDIWVVGTKGYIHYRDQSKNAWVKVSPPKSSVRFKQVAAGKDHTMWALGTDSKIYRWDGNKFNLVTGKLEDITVGADGTVWGTNSQQETFKWNGRSWQKMSALASKVAGHPDGSALVVGTDGSLYKGDNRNWNRLDIPAANVAVGSDKTIWFLGNQKSSSNGYPIYRIDNLAPTSISKDKGAEAIDMAVAPDGHIWVVNAKNEIYYTK